MQTRIHSPLIIKVSADFSGPLPPSLHPTTAVCTLRFRSFLLFSFSACCGRTRVAGAAVLRHPAAAAELPGDARAGLPRGRALRRDRCRGLVLRGGAPPAPAGRAWCLHWIYPGE